MRTFLVLLALFGSAAPLHAQFDAKQAVKDFKAELKQLTKEHKATLKAEVVGVKAGLKAAGVPFKSGDAGVGDVTDVFELLRDFQSAVFVAHSDTNDAYVILSTLLFGFEDDDATLELYPDGFAPGDGGLLDDYVADVQQRVEALYPSLRKRLDKLAKLAEKKSGLLVSYRLMPVAAMREASANPDLAAFVSALPVVIDTVIAVSDPDLPTSNRIYVSGTAQPNGSGATLTLSGPTEIELTPAISGTTGRFEASFSAEGGLPRGNYVLRARSADDATSAVLAIGLR